MIRQEVIETVKATVPAIRENGEKITTRMYEILFSKYPETKELFKNAPEDQYKRLANSLWAYGSNIDNLDNLKTAIIRMVEKHVETGVKPEHYPMVKDALMQAIKDVLNPPEEIIEAWEEAYDFLAKTLISVEKEMYEKQQMV